MIDDTVKRICDTLADKIDWLDYSFGRSFELINGDGSHYPAVHLSGNEYESVLPNDGLGNFSFFEVEDPHSLVDNSMKVKFNGNLIFWFNLNSIYGTIGNSLNIDALRKQIIEALSNRFHMHATIKINGIYEKAENIFKGYSLKQIDTQYLMLPFYGFRFSLTITERTIC